jgi:hypothetical protein
LFQKCFDFGFFARFGFEHAEQRVFDHDWCSFSDGESPSIKGFYSERCGVRWVRFGDHGELIEIATMRRLSAAGCCFVPGYPQLRISTRQRGVPICEKMFKMQVTAALRGGTNSGGTRVGVAVLHGPGRVIPEGQGQGAPNINIS